MTKTKPKPKHLRTIWAKFEKNLDCKGHRNGYKKIIGRPDPLIPAPELNERPQGKVQNIFIMLDKSLNQRKTVRNRVKCRASFLARLL